MKPILILCLGNEVLSDDSFGPTVAHLLDDAGQCSQSADIVFAPLAGFSLLDLMQNRKKVLVIDSIVTGNFRPGTLHFFPLGELAPTKNLTTSHQLNLPTAVKMGRQMGYQMPDHIDVLAVEAEDVTTLCEKMTEYIASAVEPALVHVECWLQSHSMA